jgi:hypothetical protein
MELISSLQRCPYCDAEIELLIDPSAGSTEAIEDCQVCCRPIRVWPQFDHSGELSTVNLLQEDD